MDEKVTLSKELAQSILNYLYAQPFNQVVHLIQQFQIEQQNGNKGE